MQSKKQPRKRINRFARILSAIYDVDYRITAYVYAQTEREIQVTKQVLCQVEADFNKRQVDRLINKTNFQFQFNKI